MQTRSDRFLAKVSRGAMVSTLAATCIIPDQQTFQTSPPSANSYVTAEPAFLEQLQEIAHSPSTITLSISEFPLEWTKQMETEFRRLALAEARGDIEDVQLVRLELLGRYRDRLLHPRTPDEILLQLRRDRILTKMAETIRQYVEFTEISNRKRPTA